MITPGTYQTALLLTILSMVCWGSWANTLKLAGKWRFELFYFDYSLGVLLAALVAAFTFGTLGDELTFQDNVQLAGKTQMAYALAAGVIFNLANILLVGAISIAGMAVAFPVGIGIALVVGVVWNYVLNPQGNPQLISAGVVLVVIAILFDASAYAAHARAQRAKARQDAKEAAPPPVAQGTHSRTLLQQRKTQKQASVSKGIVLCIVSGLLMGSFYPLVEMSKKGEIIGLGPYAVGVFFAIGVFLSTFIFNVYFMNLPIEGNPVPLTAYFGGTIRQHVLGVLGGAIWCTGAVSNFLAASAPKTVQVGPAISYAIGQGATIVSALWGLLLWREFAGAAGGVKLRLALMLLFFVGGLALLSLAPLFTH